MLKHSFSGCLLVAEYVNRTIADNEIHADGFVYFTFKIFLSDLETRHFTLLQPDSLKEFKGEQIGTLKMHAEQHVYGFFSFKQRTLIFDGDGANIFQVREIEVL